MSWLKAGTRSLLIFFLFFPGGILLERKNNKYRLLEVFNSSREKILIEQSYQIVNLLPTNGFRCNGSTRML
jgi:hypothetical protein